MASPNASRRIEAYGSTAPGHSSRRRSSCPRPPTARRQCPKPVQGRQGCPPDGRIARTRDSLPPHAQSPGTRPDLRIAPALRTECATGASPPENCGSGLPRRLIAAPEEEPHSGRC